MRRRNLPVIMTLLCSWLLGGEPAGTAQPPTSRRVVVLEDFETPTNWFTWAGDHDPRPTGGMIRTTTDPHGGKRCGSFYFDTSCDQGYVSTDLRYTFPPSVTQLRFWVRSPGVVNLVLRLVDSAGQTHQRSLPQQPGPWRRLVVDLTKPFPLHFGGPNDGTFHQPFTRLQFLRERGCDPKVGTVFIDDVEVVTTATTAELSAWYWRKQILRTKTDVPGNLFFPSDPAALTITADAPPDGGELVVRGETHDPRGNRVGPVGPVRLDRNNHYRATLRLPNALGYYRIALAVTDGTHHQRSETRYAVIPVNRGTQNPADGSPPERRPGSPFGVNTHFNQGWPPSLGRIIRRVGIAWIRDGEASLADRALPVALENGLCYLPCFTKWRAPLARRFKETLARDPHADRSWDFTQAVDWHRRYARKYGAHIDAYDLMNEPHGPWSEALGGDWRGGPWLTTFADYGRQVTAAIHNADPGGKVVWEDIDQLLWYREFAALPDADAIDVISPHAYNLHPARPYPEQQPTLRQMSDFTRLVRARRLAWEVWIGEVGFSSFQRTGETPTAFYSPCTETDQADLLVRMMVLQLAAGVKRIFWYDFMNDGWDPHNPEHNFGLIRNDQSPKPAVVAYANLIHRLRGVDALRRRDLGGGAFAYVCTGKAADFPLAVIAWVMTGETTVTIPVRSGVNQVTVTDLYGRSRRISVVDHQLRLRLTPSPVYIDGLRREDLPPSLSRGGVVQGPADSRS